MESSLRDDADPDLKLIETLRWDPDVGFVRLAAHYARLAAGADALGIPLRSARVDRALAEVPGTEPLRVRLTVALDGTAEASFTPLGAAKPLWTVGFAGERLRSDDPWLRIKTTHRPAYDAARTALPAGMDEVLLLNERGEVCEGTITSVFADLGDGLVTPPLGCGLLPGVLRAELIATGQVRESVLRPVDLAGARVLVGNSLRGLIPARLGVDSGGGPGCIRA